jgi:hypothetical protein
VTKASRPARPDFREPGRGKREPAGERRDRRRTATRRPEGAEDAPPPSAPSRVMSPTAHDHGQANTPERPAGQDSPNTVAPHASAGETRVGQRWPDCNHPSRP